tara:strand:- start:1039 stop:1515 length:477 start_codon:yes stop_codon:yes gene_type:complete
MVFNGRVKTSKQDNYNTPKNAWLDILQFFKKDVKLWCPFYNDGTAKTILNSLGYVDVYHEKRDFFEYELSDRIVCDNPPYSIKDVIICKLFGKYKFCLLLPLDTLERKYMLKYKKGLQLVIPNNRYEYKEGSHCPFKSCWFCWGMEEDLKTKDQLIFL